jgi:hypothetical protein
MCVLLLAGVALAQNPQRFRLDSSDAAYWSGVGVGTGLTAANPKRLLFLETRAGQMQIGEKSLYSPGRSLLIRGGIWGGIEALQFTKPNHRRLFYWSKIAAGLTYGLIGIFRDKDQFRWTGPTSITPIVP